MQLTEKELENKRKFIQAFCKFAGCGENEIAAGMQNGHAIILYNGTRYQVSSYETLSEDFGKMFETRAYSRISNEIQETAWIGLIQHIEHFSTADFIVSLYQEWNLYWKTKAGEINDEKVYNSLRNESWEQLMILIETVKISRTFASINGSKLDPCFVPIVALALRQQYEFTDHFCDDLIDIMSEAGLDNLTFGDTYEVVFMGGEKEGEPEEHYYIYNPRISVDTIHG